MGRALADDEINIRVTKRAKLKWTALAKEDNVSMSEWIKSACRSKARCEFIDERKLIEALVLLRRDMNSGVGNNLNQIAYHANLTGSLGPVETAIAEFTEIKETLNNIIRGFDKI